MTTHTYRNSFFQNGRPEYGPPFYEMDAVPFNYRGYQIFHRTACVWDVVLNGLCLSNRAGLNGAKRYIDLITQGHEE